MDSSQLDGLEWRRSSWCNGGGCVEVARRGDSVMVRRSGVPDTVVLAIPAAEWRQFVSGVRAGRFDLM